MIREWCRAAMAGAMLAAALGAAGNPAAGDDLRVVIDASARIGAFRALHGVNNGPLDLGGTIDLTAEHRALGFPSVRLHDAHWPNPDVVDIHALFPDPSADPARPESYDFARTDDYLRPIVANGAKIVFRLGESIEHTPRKIHVRPPADPDRWAAIGAGIVRHYNEGWADGHRWGIDAWEIWNEPDNRPAMWTGTDDEFCRLYAATARRLKREFPAIRVGGPGLGNVGRLAGDRLEPPPFVAHFLDLCRREDVPLDFFSWHLYAADPRAPAALARGVRRLLDERGFARTASDLTEWNYLPDEDWSPLLVGGQGPRRERFYDRIGGAEGAAFAIGALIALQDAPLDQAHYYAADTNPFGLFSRHGVPRKTSHAFRLFRTLLVGTPHRLRATTEGGPSWIVAAGGDGAGTLSVALVKPDGGAGGFDLRVEHPPWDGPTAREVFLLDAHHDLDRVASAGDPPGPIHVARSVAGPAAVLVMLRAARSPE